VRKIQCYDEARNDEVLQRTGLTSLSHLLSHRCISVFVHVARLDDDTPSNMAVQLHINVSLNWPPDHMWHRPPGRPRNKWLDQLNDSTGPIGDLWRCAVDRGHSGAMPQWPSPATWPWWWWWWYVAYYMSFSGQFPILGPNYLGSDVSVSQPIRRSYKVIMFLYTS